jgi:putative acetyltransferase
MSLTLRFYAGRDFTTLAEFWVAAWRGSGFDVNFEARRDWLQGHLAEMAGRGVEIIVACATDGSAVGFVTIDRRNGYLDQLCVAPAAQGRGVARALLDEAKRLAPGRVELRVNADNFRARAIYERAGFVVAGEGVSPTSGLPTLLLTWTSA